MILYLCVLIVFSLHRESLKVDPGDKLLPEVVLSQNFMLPTCPALVIEQVFITKIAEHNRMLCYTSYHR
jgi:hypothetical protein